MIGSNEEYIIEYHGNIIDYIELLYICDSHIEQHKLLKIKTESIIIIFIV